MIAVGLVLVTDGEEVAGDVAGVGGHGVPEPEAGAVVAGGGGFFGDEAAAGEVNGAVAAFGGGEMVALGAGEEEGVAGFEAAVVLRAAAVGDAVAGMGAHAPPGGGFEVEEGLAVGADAIGGLAAGLIGDFFEEA